VTRIATIASAAYLSGYAIASVLTGQRSLWLGNLAQIVPPLAFASLAVAVAVRSRGQVRAFWALTAAYGGLWAAGQVLWTYYELTAGEVPVVSPTDPLFFLAGLAFAAALYVRPDRERPRWLFDIVLLDVLLIAVFAIFAYLYFVASLAVAGGAEELYRANLNQLFNVRNFVVAVWAVVVWRTAATRPWRRMFGLYACALGFVFAGGLAYDAATIAAIYRTGSLWDLIWMGPFALLAAAAARAWDDRLFRPAEPVAMDRLPVVSLIAIALLILIPTTDEIARRLFHVPPFIETLRTRVALVVMIPFGVVVVIRELLSRRALQQAGLQVIAAREQLAHAEKLAAVGHLVSGVAHELNNPLQGVLGYAELLSRSGADSEELQAIRDNAERAAGIVRNLLTFAGRSTPARSWEQVNTIIRDAIRQRAPFLERAGIQLRLELADRLPLAYVNASRIQQVLLNLLENAEAAIQARRGGRVPATAIPLSETGEIIIHTSLEPDPDRLVIEIADNGTGVRPEDLNRIFDPFFTTRETGEGTGLGLSVCYGIVREHGGIISGRNRDTGGAIFTIQLPVAEDPGTRARRQSSRAELPALPALPLLEQRPPAGPSSARVLVVDDEDSNAALVRRALEQAGYLVESTTLSRRALVMIERTAYDVVVADVKMPELNGHELYSRACQIRPEMTGRFIFITGDIDSDETLEFLERSRCPFFMKPFNLERLTSAVDLMVRGKGPGERIG
jgi:signal transduction histidine kinase/CheY-like chemotaxis protein